MGKRSRLEMTGLAAAYLESLSPEERTRHLVARKYPSGQGRRGGANRSSSLRREIRLTTTKIAFCEACQGALNLPDSRIFPPCTCQSDV